jgi:hypothetical protein
LSQGGRFGGHEPIDFTRPQSDPRGDRPIAALILGSGLAIWQLRLDAIADTEGVIHSLGTIVAEQIARTLQGDDLVRYDIGDRVTPGEGISRALVHLNLKSPMISKDYSKS